VRNTVDITTANRERETILSVNGRIDTLAAPELEQAINREILNGHRSILLDFTGVSYISSGGLRVLLSAARKLKTPGDKFGICCLQPEVFKVFRLAGFTSIFSIYSSEGEALASW
jgi:anti-sigma B factor antagonist